MLSTKIAALPGASSVAALRVRARAARRAARIALTSSIALLCAVQLVAERAPAGQDTLPLAMLALGVLLAALPALALTQAVWGARARAVRRRERELYAGPPAFAGRALSRASVAAGWAVLVLLGCRVPQLFADAGRAAPAEALTGVAAALPATGAAAAACYALWWSRTPRPARQPRGRTPGRWVGRVPGDPWDPGRGRRPGAEAVVGRAGAVVAVTALVGARAHLWDPHTGVVYALLIATLVCEVVTGE